MALQIGGIASGLDTSSLIQDMMRVQRIKVDRVEQNKTVLEWKQEAYHSVNKKMADFILDSKKEFGLTSIAADGSLQNTAVSGMTWLKSANSSDEGVFTLTAKSDAVKGTYNIKVNSLAENFSAASKEGISLGEKNNLVEQFGLSNGDVLNFTLTGDKGSINVYGVVNGNELNLDITTVKDGNTSVTKIESANITSLVNRLNTADVGVRASYDHGADRFFLQTDGTGSEKTLQIEEHSNLGGKTFLSGADNLLKLSYYDKELAAYQDLEADKVYQGSNANIDFGAATGIVQNSNNFSMNGINFNLKSVGEATVTVGTDTQAVFEKIKGFVDEYNKLVTEMSTKLQEKVNRNFKPLTAEERENLSESEIATWEEQAKSGLLKNDMTIQKILSDLRLDIYKTVEGEGISDTYNTLHSVGIDFQGYVSGSLGGLLEIDETKLRAAIENDVDGVANLFFKEPSAEYNVDDDKLSAADRNQKRSESGIVQRIFDNLATGVKSIVNKAGVGENAGLYRDINSSILLDFVIKQGSISMLDESIDGYNTRINTLNLYLEKVEARLWSQFTAMEKALADMNSQSNWLMSHLGVQNNG